MTKKLSLTGILSLKPKVKGLQSRHAFTLVELIVVITIIAILGTIAFISLQGYSASSRDSVRISDVSNMKTSLELFHLNAGKYPLPDNYEIVDYAGEDLWYQGTFGGTVISQLSRNMSEVPKDPLTEREYVFSTANNKNEFEILTLLEGDIALNAMTQTKAANISVIPKLDGNYNGVFIKTTGYIVPTPSIITSEEIPLSAGLTLNNTNIKSQVTNLGKNIPNIGNVSSSTEQLNITLSVYTGSVTKDDTNAKKEEIMQLIQAAYTGSELATGDIYLYILSKTTTEELVALLDTVVLGDSSVVTSGTDTTPTNKTVLNCSSTGEILYGTVDGTDAGLTCDNDIVICDGEGTGYTIQACNIGQTDITGYSTCNSTNLGFNSIIDCTTERIGRFFQWGEMYGWDAFVGTDSTHNTLYADGFNIGGSLLSWNSLVSDTISGGENRWYGDNDPVSQGPCKIGYHVPSDLEWVNLMNLKWEPGNLGESLTNDLKMPMSGTRHSNNGSLEYQGNYSFYWSSSPILTNGYTLRYNFTGITPSFSFERAYGFPIRCFKN